MENELDPNMFRHGFKKIISGINILAFTDSPFNATSFYRDMGPFNAMMRSYGAIKVIHSNPFRWHEIGHSDIIFMQAPHLPIHAQILRHAQWHQIPVWIDLDENLIDVPTYHSSYPIYSNLDNKNAHLEVVRGASTITVSTKALAQAYSGYNENIHVVQNALPDFLLDDEINKVDNRPPHILWRGSQRHSADLAAFLPQINQIIDFAKEHKAKFTFFGYAPEVHEPFSFENHTDNIERYFRKLRELKPTICIVPLIDNAYNRCKSYNAWLETRWAGASRCIAPTMEEWDVASDTYIEPIELVQYVQTYLHKKSPPTPIALPSLSNANKIRYEVIENLME